MIQRKMNLAAFVVAGPVSGHHGGWRYPTADRDLLSLDYYRNIGRILEDGRFDLMVLQRVGKASLLVLNGQEEAVLKDIRTRYPDVQPSDLGPSYVGQLDDATAAMRGRKMSCPAALAAVNTPTTRPRLAWNQRDAM